MGWMLRIRWKDPVKGRLRYSIGGQFTAPKMRAGPPACSSQTVRFPGPCWETSWGFSDHQPFQVQVVAGDSGLFMTHWEQREVTMVDQGLPSDLDAAEIQSQGLCSFVWGDERWEVAATPARSHSIVPVLPSCGFSMSETILLWESNYTERDLDPPRTLVGY